MKQPNIVHFHGGRKEKDQETAVNLASLGMLFCTGCPNLLLPEESTDE